MLTATAEEVLGHRDAGGDLLTDSERARAAAFRRTVDRLSFTAAHVLVRICAARVLGVAPGLLTVRQRCATCGRPHGRPTLEGYPGVQLSLSHTAGVVAAAAGRHAVGVDVECADRDAPRDLGGVLAEREVAAIRTAPAPRQALLRLWVRKEAMVKLGVASLDTLSAVDLSALPVDEPHAGTRLLRHGDHYVLDWHDRARGALGAAVADRPLVKERL